MTKDEALKLALEALEDLGMKHYESTGEVLYKETFTAIKTALEAKDEPVAYLPPTASPENACYTPPQRTWVGLTDEDFLEACQIAERGNYLVAFQRIQTKLKEKNT